MWGIPMIKVLPVPVPDITEVSKPAISAKAARSCSSLGTIIPPLSMYMMRDAFKASLCLLEARESKNCTEGARFTGIMSFVIASRVASEISRTLCIKAWASGVHGSNNRWKKWYKGFQNQRTWREPEDAKRSSAQLWINIELLDWALPNTPLSLTQATAVNIPEMFTRIQYKMVLIWNDSLRFWRPVSVEIRHGITHNLLNRIPNIYSYQRYIELVVYRNFFS